jgi:hypothetical protein
LPNRGLCILIRCLSASSSFLLASAIQASSSRFFIKRFFSSLIFLFSFSHIRSHAFSLSNRCCSSISSFCLRFPSSTNRASASSNFNPPHGTKNSSKSSSFTLSIRGSVVEVISVPYLSCNNSILARVMLSCAYATCIRSTRVRGGDGGRE